MCNAQHTKTVNDTPTPRTDFYKGTHETHRVNGKTIYQHAEQLERELAEAHEMIVKMETGAWETDLELFLMQDNLRHQIGFARAENERLTRELADAIREKDNALSDYRQADTDSIRALYERNEARVQRDTLAALAGELIAVFRINYQYHRFPIATTEQIDTYLHPYEVRLKAAIVEPKS